MDENPPSSVPQTIAVMGVGRVYRAPDQADVTLSVDMTEPRAAEAQRGASERMRSVQDAVLALVDQADASTRAIALEPVYDYRESGARLTGYRASQSLEVRIRRLEDLGPLIDAAVTAGANGIAGVALGLADPATAMAEARTLAVGDARARAEGLAAAAGVRLTRLSNLEEGALPGPPRPMMRMAAEAMAADTPVAGGSTEVMVEVRATYLIEG